MGKINLLYVTFIFLLCSSTAFSQDVQEFENHIGFSLGGSSLFLTDEYISPNDYSGNALLYEFGWGNRNPLRTIQINIQFKDASNLTNDLSEASNKQFLINYRHQFTFRTGSLFSKPVNVYFGPGFSLFQSNRTQKLIPIESNLGFAAMDFNSHAQLEISDKMMVSSGLNFSLLSYASKSRTQQTGENDFSILSPLGLQNFNFSLRGRYYFTHFLYTEAAYRFNLLRSNHWDYYRLLEDVVSLQLGLRF